MITERRTARPPCGARGQRSHPSEICAVPAERLALEQPLLGVLPSLRLEWGARPVSRKVDQLSSVRFGSARYSVPCRLIGHQVEASPSTAARHDHRAVTASVFAEHQLVAPGEASILDEHYPTPRRTGRDGRPGRRTERYDLPRPRGAGRSVHPCRAPPPGGRCCPRRSPSIVADLLPAHDPADLAERAAPGDTLRAVPRRRCPLDPGHRPRRSRTRGAGDEVIVAPAAGRVRGRSTPTGSRGPA